MILVGASFQASFVELTALPQIPWLDLREYTSKGRGGAREEGKGLEGRREGERMLREKRREGKEEFSHLFDLTLTTVGTIYEY